MRIPKFSIFYNDGEVVHGGGEDDELVPVYFSKKWLEARSDGVCQVNVEGQKGTVANNQYEFYFQLPINYHGEGFIFGSNKLGPYLRQACSPLSIVKFGGWTSKDNFQEIIAKARKDKWTPQVGTLREQEESYD